MTELRLVIKKDFLDMTRAMPILQDYFGEYSPEELTGRAFAINTAILPRISDEFGVPFYLTMGWFELDGNPC